MLEVQVLMVYLLHMPTGPTSLLLHFWELPERKRPHLSASRLLQAAEEVPTPLVTFTDLLLASILTRETMVAFLFDSSIDRDVTDFNRHCWKQHSCLLHPRCYLIPRSHP